MLPKDHVFLVDIFVLKGAAFCTCNASGTNLRSILESALVPKVFFDVRNDSDALFSHFHISLAGVHDVQLMEVATRSSQSRERVAGLATCIKRDAQLTAEASALWKATKQKGLLHLAPEHGGSYESVPLPADAARHRRLLRAGRCVPSCFVESLHSEDLRGVDEKSTT